MLEPASSLLEESLLPVPASLFNVLICELSLLTSLRSLLACSTRCSTICAVSEVTVAVRFTRMLVASRNPVRATTTNTAMPPSMECLTPCFPVCLLISPPPCSLLSSVAAMMTF